ncbi:hypothetical protein [Streptacidiphilus sp. P02-A3a]|uniref:hypothetical protein n=1 Tax=Streptacidiphilus sp. P02-A3a TaxID=2704468 RepID=UPI0015FC217A|nr:hypothetical protein [Streptacidiphilus sp. P02-A3a]QMU66924.1 hypothetical protein GXP74_00525 [Streptacidiphilus sp. P02-A3a]
MTTEVADAVAVQPPQSKPRRRGRTALLMAAAVVLGVFGGGAAGYAVQDIRRPTPLPPLTVAQPRYPAARTAAPALPPDQDDMVRTDGDLTKLLVPTPRGASLAYGFSSFDTWQDIASFAEGFTQPGSEFGWLMDHSFRRAAAASWDQGSQTYLIQLVQFDPAEESNAVALIDGEETYAKTWATGSSVPLPGSDVAQVFPGKIQHSADGSGFYEGEGFGVHGDIAVEVYLQDSDGPVSEQTVQSVLQNQLERL